MVKEAPEPEEFIKELAKSLLYCVEADKSCSVSFEMARWQEWIKTWKPILDKNGGL